MRSGGNVAALRGRIHGACKALGLDEDTRRDLLQQITGHRSTTELNLADANRVIDELKRRGWAPKPRKRHPEAQRPDQRFIFVLWRLLSDAGVVQPGRAPLRAFIASRNFAAKFGDAETDPNMMSPERCYDVIEALKAVAKRHGVEVERP